MNVVERRSGGLSGAWGAWRKASALDRLLAVEALVWLAAARVAVLVLPFRAVVRLLDRRARDAAPPPPTQRIGDIVRALNAVSRRAPWRCECLERAAAGAMMLRIRRYPASVFVGVAPAAGGGPLQAHAWLRCGDLPVVGEETSVEEFAVVARFAAENPGG